MSRKVCPNEYMNKEQCTCTYPGCPRKGICCECIEHHRKNNEIPGCLFTEQGEETHDRSMENLIEDRKINKGS